MPQDQNKLVVHSVVCLSPEVDARGFHESVFDTFGDYYPPWRRQKRDPLGINSRGFHDDVFSQDFGEFHPVKRAHRFLSHRAATKNLDFDPVHKRKKRQLFDASPNQASANKKDDSATKADKDVRRRTIWGGYKSETKRKPEMMGSGFHGDTFSGGFGDFWPMKKRIPYKRSVSRNDTERELPNEFRSYYQMDKRKLGMGPSGFHGDTFTSGFGDFTTMKRSLDDYQPETEASNVYEVSTVGTNRDVQSKVKRKPEMGSNGFHGDTFNGGFGDFWTMKRDPRFQKSILLGKLDHKRRPEMDSSGFHGDTFNGGFGDFDPMKKRKPEMASSVFDADTFNGGFGDFDTMKKRKPEMGSSGFHEDTFKGGFGDFWPMKKNIPEMDSSGFHGNTPNSGFGDFSTMKKRRPEMDSSGFHGDTFNSGFGDFDPMKKRRPEMDSSGFHGDTFNSGFGDFSTMKKRRPEMDSSVFNGDTFKSGFGHPTEIRTSISPSSAVELHTTSALANYATEAGPPMCSKGQSSWLQIHRHWARSQEKLFPTLHHRRKGWWKEELRKEEAKEIGIGGLSSLTQEIELPMFSKMCNLYLLEELRWKPDMSRTNAVKVSEELFVSEM
uniref:Uncharacterized protein n=1 Tax=Timema shepardi TaxID=629360 RepID=A0A7R9FVV3_TIMSH|nr:unnamed protein product [Timema shepardi]